MTGLNNGKVSKSKAKQLIFPGEWGFIRGFLGFILWRFSITALLLGNRRLPDADFPLNGEIKRHHSGRLLLHYKFVDSFHRFSVLVIAMMPFQHGKEDGKMSRKQNNLYLM